MPAGFTHILLAKTFVENSNLESNNVSDIEAILDAGQAYLQVGAIGPDLPYSQLINPLNKESEIADLLHYTKTNQLPLRSLRDIKKMGELQNKDKAFAFIVGYISHIVADGIIHPFVRDKVGSYKDNANAHRMLEMRLDVLFLDHLSKSSGHTTEINNAKIQDEILDVLNDFDFIAEMVSKRINEIYNLQTTQNTITNWITSMEKLFEIAANEHNQYYAFLPYLKSYLYKNINELIKNKDNDLILKCDGAVDRAVNFRAKQTHFINDCVPAFYKALSPIINKAYNYVYRTGPILEHSDLPAINLDTGRKIAFNKGYQLDKEAAYWKDNSTL